MSTKTSIKRIALVAVSALGFGLLSAMPSQATTPLADTLTVSSTSVSATSGVASRVAVTTAFLATGTGNQSATQLTATLTSAPALNTAVPVFETATVATVADIGSPARAADSENGTTAVMTTRGSANNTFTQATYNLSFTPVRAGTYTIRVAQAVGVDAGSFAATAGATNALPIVITFTVAAKPEVSPTASTEVTTAVSPATGDDTTGVFAPLATLGANLATILVTASNGNNLLPLANGDVPAITASTDRGLVSWTDGSNYARVSSSAAAGNLAQTLYVRSDGTSGLATITFSYVNAAGATVVLGTKSITFYSATVASLAVTQNRTIISTASGAVLGAAAAGTANSGAVTVQARDANGTAITGRGTTVGTAAGNWYATSSNTACVSSTISSVVEGDGSALASSLGNYEINLGVGTQPTSGCSANVTISYVNSATSIITSAPFTVTAGGATIASLTLTADAASYEPGAKVTLTLTAKDSLGNPVADGAYGVWGNTSTTGALTPITASTSLTVNPFAKGASSANSYTFRKGVSTSSTFAPLTSGVVTLTSTLGTTNSNLSAALQATTLASSFTVGASSAEKAAEAAADAAAEAIDAANAATDAANLAAEAADAATVAAEEARDAADAATAAVEELATQVATLMAALRAQITTLANTVAKIAKRVRA